MDLERIDSLSPTLAWRLTECGHAVGLARRLARRAPDAQVQSPAAVLGNVAHAVIARALSTEPLDADLPADWFETAWSEAIDDAREQCVDPGSPERWRRYSLIRRGTRRLAKELRHEAAERGANPIVEQLLVANNYQLHGKPDVVLKLPDGTSEVIDIKTGGHPSGDPDPRELEQVLLYQALVEEVLSTTVVALRIARCDGPDWCGAPSSADVAAAVQRAVEAKDRFNAHRDDTLRLATPGPPCGRCAQATRCDAVWTAGIDGFVGIVGRIEHVVKEAGQHTLTVLTEAHGSVVVTGCDAPLEAGADVRLAHLANADAGQYRWQTGRSTYDVSERAR
jgi:hypothetical protein